MAQITITEKLWDAVRPSSVTKTGLSEAIRTYAKLAAKTPKTPKAFEEWVDGIKALRSVIEKTEAVTRKAKDDKKGAAAKLKAWAGECDDEIKEVGKQREAFAMKLINDEIERRVALHEKELAESKVTAAQLVKVLARGQVDNIKAIGQSLQGCRTIARDALKISQKDGLPDAIRTLPEIMDWGTDPHSVPLPASAKKLRALAAELQDLCEQVREGMESQLSDKTGRREGAIAERAEPLRKRYRDLASSLKALIPAAKKFASDTKVAGDKIKTLLANDTGVDKLLPFVDQIHERLITFEHKANGLNFHGRSSKGDLMKAKQEAKKGLETKDADEFEGIIMDEWNVCMVVYREISERLAESYRQVDRMLRLVVEAQPEAASEVQRREQQYRSERADAKNRYM